MFFRSASTKNEFLESCQDQSSATLVLGQDRLVCRIVEVSISGFSILVPRSSVWMGEPLTRLATSQANYKVRIVKQKAKADGFQFTLQRVDELTPEVLTNSQRWVVYGSRCCSIGLIMAIGYCFVVASYGMAHGSAHPLSVHTIAGFWCESWDTLWGTTSSMTPPGDVALLPRIDVSMSFDDEEPETSNAIKISAVSNGGEAMLVADRRALLQAAVNSANSQPSRPLNSKTFPWLLPSEQAGRTSVRCRISCSAENDLQMFATCLQELSETSANGATGSLRAAIASIATKSASAVDGFPSLRLIRSDDAEIYFRMMDGEIELLRVLPIELKDAVPSRVPSASASPQSRHR